MARAGQPSGPKRGPIDDVYRLVDVEHGYSPTDGRPATRLVLTDVFTTKLSHWAYLHDGGAAGKNLNRHSLQAGMLVSIDGTIKQTRLSDFYIEVGDFQPVWETEDGFGWQQLPLSAIPPSARYAYAHMAQILEQLESQPLYNFMDRLWRDTELVTRFIQSRPYRYNRPEGTPGWQLIESVMRAERAERLGPVLVGREDTPLLIVASLLRDIGVAHPKATTSMDRESLEFWASALLSPHLCDLKDESYGTAMALAETLMPGLINEAIGSEDSNLCVDFIRQLDNLTTADELFGPRHTICTSSGEVLTSFYLPRQS